MNIPACIMMESPAIIIEPSVEAIPTLEIVDVVYRAHPHTHADICTILKPWAHRDICTCICDYLQYGAIPTNLMPVDLSSFAKTGWLIYDIRIYEQFTEIQYIDAEDEPGPREYYYAGKHIYTYDFGGDVYYLYGRDSLLIFHFVLSALGGIDRILILTADGKITNVTVLTDPCDISVIRGLLGAKYSIYYANVINWHYILCNDVLYRYRTDITCIVPQDFILYPDVSLEQWVPSRITTTSDERNLVRVLHISTGERSIYTHVTDGSFLYANLARTHIMREYDGTIKPHILLFDKDLSWVESLGDTTIRNREMTQIVDIGGITTIDVFPFHGGYIIRTAIDTHILNKNHKPWDYTDTLTAHAFVFGKLDNAKYTIKWLNDMPELRYAGRCDTKFYFANMGKLYTWL